ncbi:MAG: site-specific tyrosine recombinase XerD [Melioribacteraceae bacterium]|nr:site-specific tyrosine recombinase XerD [Melioribacteraceae bacterium]MCF8263947.1 site-specific tyrosine recombinase XerD [Melioribacteraceae bacterium]
MKVFLKEYLIVLKFERNLSENTLQSYKNDIESFLTFLDNEGLADASEITYNLLLKYFEHQKKADKSSSSNARYLSSIRGFLTYLYDSKYIEKNPSETLPSPKLQRKLPVVLSIDEVNKILSLPDNSTVLGKRDKAMLEVFYSSGLRVSELINLKTGDMFLDEELLRVLGKGNKQRLVPIGSSAINAVTDYMLYARPSLENKVLSKGFIFLNRRHKNLSRMGVWKLIDKYTKEANITKEVHPHTFRHTFATHLINGGADLRAVQEMLGHSDISTTQIYTHIEKDYVKQMHRDFHPRG